MKSKTIKNQGYNLTVALIITVILFVLGTGCNSNKSKEKANGADSTNKEPSNTVNVTAGMSLTGDLYTVKLSKASYAALNATPSTVKLVLQFYFNSDDSKTPGLIAYPAKNNNKFVHPSANPADEKKALADTLHPDQPGTAIESKMVFGDNEITYADLDRYIRDNAPGDAYTFIVFTPRIDPDTRHVFYGVTLEGTTHQLNGTLNTNPSPPKDASN